MMRYNRYLWLKRVDEELLRIDNATREKHHYLRWFLKYKMVQLAGSFELGRSGGGYKLYSITEWGQNWLQWYQEDAQKHPELRSRL